jgi:hypothetical protein
MIAQRRDSFPDCAPRALRAAAGGLHMATVQWSNSVPAGDKPQPSTLTTAAFICASQLPRMFGEVEAELADREVSAAEKCACANAPAWSAGCSPRTYHLARRDLERGLRLGSRAQPMWEVWPAVAARGHQPGSPLFPDRARRKEGAERTRRQGRTGLVQRDEEPSPAHSYALAEGSAISGSVSPVRRWPGHPPAPCGGEIPVFTARGPLVPVPLRSLPVGGGIVYKPAPSSTARSASVASRSQWTASSSSRAFTARVVTPSAICRARAALRR